MSQHLIDEEPDPKQIKPVDQTEEATNLDEEATNQDQDEEEISEEETMEIGMASTANSAKFQGTDKRNAGKG
jgi:hypothetical protein